MATMAMFVALGGVSWAGLMITGANVKIGSLTGAHVKNGSLTGADIKTGSVPGGDIADGSITGADVNESSLGKVPSAGAADMASSAGLLDGHAPSAFLGASAKATNADKLDGMDCTALATAPVVGHADGTSVPLAGFGLIVGSYEVEVASGDCGSAPGPFRIEVVTDGDSDESSQIRIRNTGSGDVWYFAEGTAGTAGTVAPQAVSGEIGPAGGEPHRVIVSDGLGLADVTCFHTGIATKCLMYLRLKGL